MPLTDAPASPDRRTRKRSLKGVGVLIACSVLLLGLVLTLPLLIREAGGSKPPRAANVVQGPRFPAATVTNSAGETVVCPLGATPTVNITNAYFTPRLTGGTSFSPGIYQIELTGTVVNETTSPITIKALHPTLGRKPWQSVTITAPDHLDANSSGRLVVKGTFRSTGTAQADVGTTVDWAWADPRLAACDDKGLIDDD